MWTRKNLLNFGNYPFLDRNTTSFWNEHCEIGHFIHNLAHVSGKNWSNFHENFTIDISLDKEVPVKFVKSSWSVLDLPSRSYALSWVFIAVLARFSRFLLFLYFWILLCFVRSPAVMDILSLSGRLTAIMANKYKYILSFLFQSQLIQVIVMKSETYHTIGDCWDTRWSPTLRYEKGNKQTSSSKHHT